MLDDKDIQKLIEVFATKEDFKELKQEVADLRGAIQALVDPSNCQKGGN